MIESIRLLDLPKQSFQHFSEKFKLPIYVMCWMRTGAISCPVKIENIQILMAYVEFYELSNFKG